MSLTKCANCGASFDNAVRFTVCPHIHLVHPDHQPTAADTANVPDPLKPRTFANPQTEGEHACFNAGFSQGYEEGRNDLLFALASGHAWAAEKLASVKAEMER